MESQRSQVDAGRHTQTDSRHGRCLHTHRTDDLRLSLIRRHLIEATFLPTDVCSCLLYAHINTSPGNQIISRSECWGVTRTPKHILSWHFPHRHYCHRHSKHNTSFLCAGMCGKHVFKYIQSNIPPFVESMSRHQRPSSDLLRLATSLVFTTFGGIVLNIVNQN